MAKLDDMSIEEIVYRIRALRMAAGIMHIGAHPDDEDIGLLSYAAHKCGARAIYWSATRGEGGQNRVGPYSAEPLGVYRTWETLEARSEDGGVASFGPFYDFGYCKDATDAFTKWGEENVVREMVRAIRLWKPAVLVSRWLGEPSDLHGHHQAVGIAVYKAFEAAGNPDMFPEFVEEGLSAWQPLKLYHSTDNTGGDYSAGAAFNLFGNINDDLEKDGILRINTGELEPVSGKTYQERAWTAYNKHQTQGLGLKPAPGDFYYYFSLYKSHVKVPARETTFFDGFDPTLSGLAERLGNDANTVREKLASAVECADKALETLRVDNRSGASICLLVGLARIREAGRALEDVEADPHTKKAVTDYIAEKTEEFEIAAAKCNGIELEGLSAEATVTPNQKFTVTSHLWNHGGADVNDVEMVLETPTGWDIKAGKTNREGRHTSVDFEVAAGKMASFSCPYWLVTPRSGYEYEWPTGEPCSRPFGPPELQVACRMKLGAEEITLRTPAIQRTAFAGGCRELPVTVIPPISLQPKSSLHFRPVSENEQILEIQVTARNNSYGEISGEMGLDILEGWKSEPASLEFSLPEYGDSKTVVFKVCIPAGVPEQTYTIRCKVSSGGRDYSHTVTPVRMGTPGLPGDPDVSNCSKESNIISPAEIKVFLINVEFAKRQTCAYVPGLKDGIRDALEPFGISFQELSGKELAYGDLSKFDVIVIGPNAYLASQDVRDNAQQLLNYAKNGGCLIIQYQGYGYQDKGFTPYDFHYNQPHDRVTYEKAAVTILEPDHPVFNFPNTIETKDFDGWVHDRGMYFFREYDKQYKPLMSCFDIGEEPREGGYLACQYGRGDFFYTGYSFHRQLPAGVGGAFRLFANLLALPAARLRERMDFLQSIDLFSEFKEDQLESVARIMFQRWEDDGTVLCKRGDTGDELYFVYSGTVDVLLSEGEGKEEKAIASVDVGACVGEMAVLGDIPRTATLRANGDIELLVISGKDFQSVLNENPRMAIKLLNLLVKRVHQYQQKTG